WPTNSSSDPGRMRAASGWTPGGGWNSGSGRAPPGFVRGVGIRPVYGPGVSRPASARLPQPSILDVLAVRVEGDRQRGVERRFAGECLDRPQPQDLGDDPQRDQEEDDPTTDDRDQRTSR